jgi:hypothetical protein
MRLARHVARMAERRCVCSVLVGKTEGKRPLGRPTRRWEGNIHVDLQELGCGVMELAHAFTSPSYEIFTSVFVL